MRTRDQDSSPSQARQDNRNIGKGQALLKYCFAPVSTVYDTPGYMSAGSPRMSVPWQNSISNTNLNYAFDTIVTYWRMTMPIGLKYDSQFFLFCRDFITSSVFPLYSPYAGQYLNIEHDIEIAFYDYVVGLQYVNEAEKAYFRRFLSDTKKVNTAWEHAVRYTADVARSEGKTLARHVRDVLSVKDRLNTAIMTSSGPRGLL